MTLTNNRQICTRPFEWFEIHPDGSIFLCCPAWLKRPVGNLLKQSISAIWNGPIAQEIRKSILNGSFHNCALKHCPHLIGKTLPFSSVESIEDSDVKDAITLKQARLPYQPRHLNLCYDHSCNLAFPSCRDKGQQATGAELSRIQSISHIVLESLLPHTKSLTLNGLGVPFGSQSYFNLLHQINLKDFPELIDVRLHTNGQLLTPAVWQSLPDLQPLLAEIEVSIDAASASTYELNRPGGNYTQLLSNLEFIKNLPLKRTLSMVVQQNNWRELQSLAMLAQRYNADAYFSHLVNWGTFQRKEYESRAVHLPTHPEHPEYVTLLKRFRHSPGLRLVILATIHHDPG